ncbi:unnamed protein product [Prorocentrum cordatum]|uniref:tRNA-dihydrouridine(16/17) synthase [NAD(P)(+)] n=1 Tax=Prorocentrum cordatum TaxID=2364126 RepID=A0ABN9UIM5_9DINO|nr:unnamed protein product [Polarella glacialis]
MFWIKWHRTPGFFNVAHLGTIFGRKREQRMASHLAEHGDSDGEDTSMTIGDRRRYRRRARRRQANEQKQREVAGDLLEPWPALDVSRRPARGLTGYEWWRSIGSPRFVCAPMVGGSSLAFRMLVRRYGCDLAFSPMIDAAGWRCGTTVSRRDRFLWSKPLVGDVPLVAQLAGDDPKTVAAAGRDVAHACDAIDLNCGCPQPCAELGRYGAFLLSMPDCIEAIVRECVHSVPEVPITVKLRKPSNRAEDMLALAARLEAAGASALTVHGRTKEQIGQFKGVADWDVVAAVKQRASIPIILNGGIGSREDALRALQVTRCDAVMSAEALLERPTLFAEEPPLNHYQIVEEFLDLARTYHTPPKALSVNMFALLHGAFQRHPEVYARAPDRGGVEAWAGCVRELHQCSIVKTYSPSTTCPGPWYLRHR